MDDERLKAIAERRKAASQESPMEWSGARVVSGEVPHVPQCSHLGNTLVMLDDIYEGSDDDCAFIAAAFDDVPDLLAHVASLTARAEKAERALTEARDMLVEAARWLRSDRETVSLAERLADFASTR